jgi:hypothetical protein
MQCVLQDQSIQIRTGATDKSYWKRNMNFMAGCIT